MSEKNITINIAGIQMASGPNVSANMIEAGRLISLATDAEAKLIVLPENFAIMGMKEQDKVAIREKPGDGPIQSFLSEQAAKYKVWLVGGTIPMETTDPKKVRAACLLYNDQGQQVARYDKAHLFDVQIYQSNEKYNESETIEAGDQVVVVDTPFGKLGLAVFYDLRFPEFFRKMKIRGVRARCQDRRSR